MFDFLFNKQKKVSTGNLESISFQQTEIIDTLITDIAGTLKLDDVLQKSADSIVDALKLHGCILFLKDESGKFIYTKTISQSGQSRVALSLLKVDSFLDKLKVSMDRADNLVVDTMLNKRNNISPELWRFTIGVLDKSSVDLIQTATFTGASISVPVKFKGEIIGALLFTKISKTDDFEAELPIISIYASQVGIAIANATLFNKEQKQVLLLERQNRDLQSLYNLTSQISSTLDPEQVAQNAVNSLPQDDNMVGAVLATYNEEQQKIVVHAVTENQLSYQVKKIIGDFSQYPIFMYDKSYVKNPTLNAVKFDSVQYTNDVGEFLTPPVPKQFVPLVAKILNIKSIAVFPVHARGKVIGTIAYFMRIKNFPELEENQKQLLETYTAQIGIALENANLFTRSQIIQQNLEKALDEIQKRRRFEQDMIDVMGHELRTPMSIVRNALSLMEMDIRNKGEIENDHQKKYVEMGLDSARREVNLIETLLSATKTDGKGFQLILQQVDLLDVINTAILGAKKDAEKKGLQLMYTPPTQPILIYCDRTRIQEIADNFLSNAVKYTEKGSVTLTATIDDKFGWINMIDTGVGIKEEDLKKLGQKFFRAQQYTEEDAKKGENLGVIRPGGTGLGLYVSFSLIKVMEGKLDIKSTYGSGSTFAFGMPLYTGQKTLQVLRKAESYFDSENTTNEKK